MDVDRLTPLRSDGSRQHVLLICPTLFSYHVTMRETLRAMGYGVTWWDERANTSLLYKLALRLFPVRTARRFERGFLDRLKQLDPADISHVLVIKGEGLSRHVALELRRVLKFASLGLYLWDSVANTRGATEILPAFDSVATFDPLDARTFRWTYRPLFARNVHSDARAPVPTRYDWCFIGTIHSDRHRVIHRLRRRAGPGVRSFVFAYFQSPLILLVRKMTDWTLWLAPKGTLSTEPMPGEAVADVVRRSVAVLDVEHPRQRGFTMRTIETLLAGKKLITTNEHIVDSDLYHPSRAHVISRRTPDIPPEFVGQPFATIPDSIRQRYSCEAWLGELLKLQDTGRARSSTRDASRLSA